MTAGIDIDRLTVQVIMRQAPKGRLIGWSPESVRAVIEDTVELTRHGIEADESQRVGGPGRRGYPAIGRRDDRGDSRELDGNSRTSTGVGGDARGLRNHNARYLASLEGCRAPANNMAGRAMMRRTGMRASAVLTVAALVALWALAGCASPQDIAAAKAAAEKRAQPEIDATISLLVEGLCNMRVSTMNRQLDTDDKALGASLLCPELQELVDKINAARQPALTDPGP